LATLPLRELLSNLGRLSKPRQRIRSANGEGRRQTIFSFVVDTDPKFAYQGYHLARSLIEHCGGDAAAVHAQFTPEVRAATRQPFEELGCTLHEVSRFGELAIHMAQVPFLLAPSNVNYFVHFAADHRYFDRNREIALIHCHDSLNALGLLEPSIQLNDTERAAIAKANFQIESVFDNGLFWDLRYSRFSDRGSGFGSRGESLVYKRALLRHEGAEEAESVLDFGCGDLEVLKVLDLKGYLGIECSQIALALAQQARPEWAFQMCDESKVAIAEAFRDLL
jgi:hypothetical protein